MSAGEADEDGVLLDDDGYPTEWGLGRLRAFTGSPRRLVDLLEQLWWRPTLMTVDEWLHGQLRTVVRASLATGGWSGNEEIIDVLGGTMFHLRLWESSHREGRHVYEVEMAQWEVVSQLGAITVEGTPGG